MKAKAKKSEALRPLQVLNVKVAGIDVGASCHYVCFGALSGLSTGRSQRGKGA